MPPDFTLISAGTKSNLASVQRVDGSTIEISWKELLPYCYFANPPLDPEEFAKILNTEPFDEEAADYEENDYCVISIVGHHLVACLTIAQGQDGVVAVWDLSSSKWVYIAQCEYIQAAIPLFEHGLIVMLVDIMVPYVGSPLTPYRVWVAPLDGRLDGRRNRSKRLPIKPPPNHSPQNIKQPSVIFNSPHKDGGCYGLFFDQKTKILYAGDGQGFSVNYSIAELKAALSKR